MLKAKDNKVAEPKADAAAEEAPKKTLSAPAIIKSSPKIKRVDH